MKGILGLFLFFAFSLGFSAKAQKVDTLQQAKNVNPIHSPRKASLYSAILPGLGQAYNHKYWKIPIIYAGFVTLGYFIKDNNQEYRRFKTAYKNLTDGDPLTIDEFNGARSADELLFYKDQYRRWRDISVIITVATYALNIIDANVDAHFFNYSISPDLSLELSPAINNQGVPQLCLKFGF